MGFLSEDVVIITQPDNEGDPTVIAISCPDKRGLGSDLSRIILSFGLSTVKADFSTDGKWSYGVLWVIGDSQTRWNLLKERLVGVCPSSSPSAIFNYSSEIQSPKPPDVFLLKLCSYDRRGLLDDVIEVLWVLELKIKKVKVSTMPDGIVINQFFITDTRQETTYEHLKAIVGNALISCEIEMVDTEICSQASSSLPFALTEDMFHMEMPDDVPRGSLTSSNVSITIDDLLSPVHTVFQIACHDHKGLLFDIMRTLKDENIQISYGRFSTKPGGNCEIELFIVQADGAKIVDPSKQNALSSRLQKDLLQPLRVSVVSRGPDTELLVANPVELSGKGRPLVFHDVTLALKMLNICISSAEIGRHMIGDREWEVYKVLLDEGDGLSVPKSNIEEGVWNMLMGWK